MTRSIPWPRILAEGVAIVVSILLAFGIQAWWEGLGDEQRRQALLQGLQADFAAAQLELDRVTHIYRRVSDAGRRYLVLARSGPPSESSRAVVDSLLSDMYWSPTYDAPVGTIEAFLNTGELDLLGSPELVSELTAFMSAVENLADNEVDGKAGLGDGILPHLRSRGVRLADLQWTDLLEDELPYELAHTDAYLLLADAELESLVVERWFTYELLIRNAEVVQEHIHGVQAVLSSERATAS